MNRRIDAVGLQRHWLVGLVEEGKRVYVGCACGKEKWIDRNSFISGVVKSCGCYRDMKLREAVVTHGQSGTGAHRSWKAMLARCRNPNHEKYFRYGGAGVKVCARWYSFENFLADMGQRPENKELSRKGDRGDYEPGNVEWKTHRENILEKGK